MKSNSTLKLLLTLLVMVFFTAGSFAKSNSVKTTPDYSGTWDLYFYDNAGKVVGAKKLEVSEDGSISAKANIILATVVYDTRVSAVVLKNGRVTDGELMYMTKQDMVGSITGNFTETVGSGEWKNYMGNSGTWKATRSNTKAHD